MVEPVRLEVINREGWRREYPVTKNIIHIGSAPHNDIVLDAAYGSGVAPRHLQLVPMPSGQGFRAVNMANTDLVLGDSGAQVVPPRSFVDLAPGQQIKLGDFTVIVHGSGSVAPQMSATPGAVGSVIRNNNHRTSYVIGLRVDLSDTRLSPNHPINGVIAISNEGDKTGVQFKIDVEGLDLEDYEVGPGPILFPGAEKEVVFRINHPRKPLPPAGPHQIHVHVTAPAAYPGETATASQTITILPYYSHRLALRPAN